MEFWIARDKVGSEDPPRSRLKLWYGEPVFTGQIFDSPFRCTTINPARFPDLLPGQKRRMTLVQLSDTTGNTCGLCGKPT